jgi:hypothetical protein
VQRLDGNGVGVDVVAATANGRFPPLQRPPRSAQVRVCGEHCSTTNVSLRALAPPYLFGAAGRGAHIHRW